MSFKKQRVGDLLLGFLAEEIRRLMDPRLELVTLTAVDMSADLKNARVYWSVAVLSENSGLTSQFPNSKQIAEVEEALKGVVNLLKRRIASELELRYTPQLHFKYDQSIETASRIEELVRKVGS